MRQMDIAVLLTSSLQNSTLEYLPLSKGELLLAVPEKHPALVSEYPFEDDENHSPVNVI